MHGSTHSSLMHASEVGQSPSDEHSGGIVVVVGAVVVGSAVVGDTVVGDALVGDVVVGDVVVGASVVVVDVVVDVVVELSSCSVSQPSPSLAIEFNVISASSKMSKHAVT